MDCVGKCRKCSKKMKSFTIFIFFIKLLLKKFFFSCRFHFFTTLPTLTIKLVIDIINIIKLIPKMNCVAKSYANFKTV
jgi:hypothetical protein